MAWESQAGSSLPHTSCAGSLKLLTIGDIGKHHKPVLFHPGRKSQQVLSAHHLPTTYSCPSFLSFPFSFFLFIYLYVYLFIYRERGREGGKEGKKHQCVSLLLLTRPLLGTWPATQTSVLTGNGTSDPLLCSPALNLLRHTSQGYFLVLTYIYKMILFSKLYVA